MGQPTFAVLGPLRVSAGGVPIRVGGPKAARILATLLLRPTRSASVDVLTEVLWPSGAPASAVANIRTYVNGVRKAFAAGGLDPKRVRTEPSGYAIDIDDGDLDLVRFEQLLDCARALRTDGDSQRAVDTYDAALALWRGPVLQGLAPSPVWDPALTHLDELRASAVAERAELHLALGRYETVVADLKALLAEDPVRENLWQMLVQALHQTGRTAEARSAYAQAHSVLVSELGVGPGERLRQLGEQLGVDDGVHHATEPPTTPAPVCQLPIDVTDFTGRGDTVRALERLVRTVDRSPVVAVLHGAPGVGKTTLAVHLAHRARDAFPDGQLFLEFSSANTRPRSPAEVLAEVLRCLGVPGGAIPDDLRERTALFRSRVADRRVLMVLDDVPDGDAVRPLLPGAGASAVLVTSRRRLPDLPGRHLEVGPMEPSDARALFASIVGPERVRAEPGDTEEVLSACGHLPLAVRIAGSRLAHRPGWTIRDLADSLRNEHQRLDTLKAGSLEVRSAAARSYHDLGPVPAATFRALGQLPPVPLPGWLVTSAAAAPADPQDPVEALLTEHLISYVGTDRVGQPRYQVPGLLHAYAAELAAREPRADRQERHRRLIQSFTELAQAANRRMPIRFFGIVGHPVSSRGTSHPSVDLVRSDPVTWFATERHLLVHAVETAVELGLPSQAADLAVELAGYFDLHGHYHDWMRTHQVALRARPDTPDRTAAALLRNIGQLHVYQDRYAEAFTAFTQARRMLRTLGDAWGESVAAIGTGSAHKIRGELDAAMRDFTSALRTFEGTDDPHGQTVAHSAIASVWLDRGQPDLAAPRLQTALRMSAELGDRHREAQVRRRMAVLYEMRGDSRTAHQQLRSALVTFEDLSDAHCAAYVRQAIAELCLREGRPAAASPLLNAALTVHRQLGDRRAVASTTSLLGEVSQASGRTGAARRFFRRSLSAWRQLADTEKAAMIDARLRELG